MSRISRTRAVTAAALDLPAPPPPPRPAGLARGAPSVSRAPAPRSWLTRVLDALHLRRPAVAAAMIGALCLPTTAGAELLPSPDPAATAPQVVRYWGSPSLVAEAYLTDGTVTLDTGLRPYTRSYAQAQLGPLRFRHGSAVPLSSIHDPTATGALQAKPPGRAIDDMARRLGEQTAFEIMASDQRFFDPSRPPWWGQCAPWAWTALHPRISPLVDVGGSEGQRGVWFAGEWLSRADLGTWTMSVASPFVEFAAESVDAQSVGDPGARGILAAVGLLAGGQAGVIADIHNDGAEGSKETWNQPFFKGTVGVSSVSGPAADALLAYAAEDGWKGLSAVKLVRVVAYFGDEDRVARDAYEGPPHVSEKRWNIYAAVNEEGIARWAVMATDPRLAGAPGLPERQSHAAPDYFAQLPLDVLDAALDGAPHGAIDRLREGRELRFFLGKVLPGAIPGEVRAAFEADLATRPAGPLDQGSARQLARRYPGVARAFAPEEWATYFAPRGLDAADFGWR